MSKHIFSIAKNTEEFLTIQSTPWNDEATGFCCYELLDKTTDPDLFALLLKQVVKFILNNSIDYVQYKSDDNRNKREHLLENGFYYSELSYSLSFKKPANADFKPSTRIAIELKRVNTKSEFNFIESCAETDFHHGRLLEDLRIDQKKARLRNKKWISTLSNPDFEMYIALCRGKAIGFHIQKVDASNNVNWVLTGTSEEYSMLSLPLWESIFMMAQTRGFHDIRTVVSASNYKMLNIYNYFPFRIDKCFHGYNYFVR